MTNFRHMDPNDIKLVGLHRAEFERAKADRKRCWWTQVCVVLLACISIFMPKEIVTYSTTVLALIAVGLWCFFSWRSRQRHRTAERARRALLLIQGLGWKPSGKEMADVLASFSASESEGELWEDENYFASVGNPGPEALAAIIQESAFWSKHLFSLCAKRYWLYSIIAVALSLVILLAIPAVPIQKWPIIIARIVCVILMFLVSIDLFGMAIAYSETAHVISGIDDRLAYTISSRGSESDLMFVFGDYNAAVQGAPLISTRIYQENRERLNQLWRKRGSGRNGEKNNDLKG